MPCNYAAKNRRSWSFGESYHLHLQGQRVTQARNQRSASFCWFLAWLALRPWRWKQYGLPKRLCASTGLHGVTTQNTVLFTRWSPPPPPPLMRTLSACLTFSQEVTKFQTLYRRTLRADKLSYISLKEEDMISELIEIVSLYFHECTILQLHNIKSIFLFICKEWDTQWNAVLIKPASAWLARLWRLSHANMSYVCSGWYARATIFFFFGINVCYAIISHTCSTIERTFSK
jgi:hypothetical protein